MRVDAFDYDLPEELIALRPLERRDEARLLRVGAGDLEDLQIADLPDLLNPGDLVIVNNTKVIPANLTTVRPPRAEGGNTDPVPIDLTLLRCLEGSLWEALARPAKRLRVGDQLTAAADTVITVKEMLGEGKVQVEFACSPAQVSELMAETGTMPLPPYIASRRAIDNADAHDYQTVFAKTEGAVAAPTAGLHLTTELLSGLRAQGVEVAEVTLHVGLGTFLPVKVDDTDAHVMHAEWGEVTQATADAFNRVRAQSGRILAVGTTSLRLLESAADKNGRLGPFAGETSIFIVPGYSFRTADLLLTNFHLPRSTLFMMVSAFSGLQRMKRAYRHGIAAKYRFYSYGDACLLERAASSKS